MYISHRLSWQRSAPPRPVVPSNPDGPAEELMQPNSHTADPGHSTKEGSMTRFKFFTLDGTHSKLFLGLCCHQRWKRVNVFCPHLSMFIRSVSIQSNKRMDTFHWNSQNVITGSTWTAYHSKSAHSRWLPQLCNLSENKTGYNTHTHTELKFGVIGQI